MEHAFSRFEKYVFGLGVSRETLDKCIRYHELLLSWQKKINLVSSTTIENAWERHFLDSAQLFPLISDSNKSIFDLGSGAGFPGLVLSILGVTNICLLESDQRKCIFLSEVIREVGATAKVINGRIESVKNTKAHMITSRACASLDQLLTYAYPLLEEGGECLFLKGRGATEEIKAAERNWVFHVKQSPSIVDEQGAVLQIAHIAKRR